MQSVRALGSTCTQGLSWQRRPMGGVTGQLFQFQSILTTSRPCRSWLADLPGPAAVAYEARPTGFGLCRHLMAAGIRCEVVAPSKLVRTSRTRSTCPAVAVGGNHPRGHPHSRSGTARDLVRAREDVRGDLMPARHRLQMLRMRNGIVYEGGKDQGQVGLGGLRKPPRKCDQVGPFGVAQALRQDGVLGGGSWRCMRRSSRPLEEGTTGMALLGVADREPALGVVRPFIELVWRWLPRVVKDRSERAGI